MEDLTKLPNIGSVLAEILGGVGITKYEDLASLGSIQVLLKIRTLIDPSACTNMLYAVEGAIRGVRWHNIPKEERQRLKSEYELALRKAA